MEEFEGWLQANEAHYPRLTFAVSDLGGRGGIATEDIQPGEELCSIPVRLVLTTEIARQSEVGRLVAAHLNAVQGERLRVSAGRAILCAYLIHQRAAQDAFWGPYLRSLPSTFSTPLYWYTDTRPAHTTTQASRADDKELDDRPDEDIQHLAGTNLFYAMQEKQQQIRESFDLLFPALCHAHPTVFPPDLFTWEHFLWAFTACSSRSFPQTLVQQPTVTTSAHADPYDLLEIDECLLPGLDMLNHQYRKKITWALDPSAGRLRFVTEDKVEKGTEAFNNYGPKGNEELLMGYGFCIEDNEQDYVMIRLSFSPADPLAARKKALLGRLKLPVLQALRRDYVPPALLDALRVSVMTQWELYFFDADELDDDSSCIADDGMSQRKRKRTETEGGLTPASENGSVFVNWRNELEMTQTLKGLLEDKVRKLGPGPQALTAVHNSGNVRNATIYKNGQRRVLDSCIEAVVRMMSQTARRANAAALAQIASAAASAEPTTAYPPPPGIDHLLRFTSDGVFAAQDVPAGQALLTIPRQLLITVDTALESPLGEALQYVEGGLDEDTVLTLFLVWEKGRGEASPWYPFLSAVRHKKPAPVKNKHKSTTATKTKAPVRRKPAAQKRAVAKEEKAMELVEEAGGGAGGEETKNEAGEEDAEWAGEVDLPLAWTKEERSLLGPDFETASQLGETEEGLKELYSQLFPALSQALPQYFPRALFSWANFRWAAMVLDSHSVRVVVPPPASAADKAMAVDNGVQDDDGEEEEESEAGEADATTLSAGPTTITVVLPLAVLPRHHPYACMVTTLGSPTGEGPLTLRSLAPVAEGDPIHLAVGRGPTSAELMLRRGRIAGAADANPFDALRFPFPAQIPLTHAKLALLQRLELEDDIRARSHFLRGHGPLPSKLIDTLRVIFLPDDAVERLLATASAGGLLGLPTDVDAQVAALIEGSLRSLLSGLTAAGPEATGAKGRKLRRTQRAREYLAAQRHIVTHNLTQVAGWALTKQ